MALLSTNRVAWQYHAEGGAIYRVAAQAAIVTQGKLGGEAWAGVVGPKPRSIKMRSLTVRSNTLGVSRVVPVYSSDATILDAGATVNLNHLADSAAFTSDGGDHIISEQRPRSSVTKQST